MMGDEVKNEGINTGMAVNPVPPPPPPDTPEPPPTEEEKEIDEFEKMSKIELRTHVKRNKLQITKYKKLNPDELREAIRNYASPVPEEAKEDKKEDQPQPVPEKAKKEDQPQVSPSATKIRPKTDKLRSIIKKELNKSLASKVIIAFDAAVKAQPKGDPIRVMLNCVRVNSNNAVMNNIMLKLK